MTFQLKTFFQTIKKNKYGQKKSQSLGMENKFQLYTEFVHESRRTGTAEVPIKFFENFRRTFAQSQTSDNFYGLSYCRYEFENLGTMWRFEILLNVQYVGRYTSNTGRNLQDGNVPMGYERNDSLQLFYAISSDKEGEKIE